MKRLVFIFLGLILLGVSMWAQEKVVEVKIIQTSDIHGNYFPYNFKTRKDYPGSLARVYSLVEKKREQYKENLILIDNGDILQGQPTSYYYNNIDTVSPHLCSEMMNYMKYDVGNVGNHDVEAGHSVFDRWAKNCNFPILGANVIDVSTNEPYFSPYKVMIRDGVKIVILGMVTPAIPVWVAESRWKGLRFEDMEKTARKWMKIIREKENPDVMIGLFHSGEDAVKLSDKYNENASLNVAKRVPGFDLVLIGHDHLTDCKKILNVAGDSVLVIDPAKNGVVVSDIDVTLRLKNGKVCDKQIKGTLTKTEDYGINQDFMTKFRPQYEKVNEFVSQKIGFFTNGLSIHSCFFGPCAFIDLIHALQLDITGADISFTAPFSLNAKIEKGDVYIGDMFSLYRYENMLHVMKLSGKEIKDYLEMAYYLWTNQMKSPSDHLLWFREGVNQDEDGNRDFFQNFSFNFDSASGIIYTIDVTKPKGKKINIVSMADGSPFYMNKIYKVALNSYRANGGGELLTKGAGIPQKKLRERIISSTAKDLRYYLIKYIEKKKVITPKALNQWKFIPEEWVLPAAKRDYNFLFGDSL